jgi:glycosyltransferase involved in cell wall biosynthesis
LKISTTRIIWLLHEAHISGANIAALEYAQKLKQEFSIHFILPHKGSMEIELEKANISYTLIHQYNWTGGELRGIKKIRFYIRTKIAIAQIKALIHKLKTDLIFTNTIVPFTASKAAQALNKPHVWWVHEFGEEDFGFSIGNGNAAAAYKLMRESKLIICNSKAVAKKFQLLLKDADVRTLYQPVSWQSLTVSANKKEVFLMFGQLTVSKGHMEVLRALAHNKQSGKMNVKVHMKGPCEDKAYLHQLDLFIQKHDLTDTVTIDVGYFKKEEVISCYRALIVASASEAFGRVIVEAIKANVKVIVKNSGGAPELVNTSNGVLYNTIEELAALLSKEKILPEITSQLSYDEGKEIIKLKEWIHQLK